MSQGEGPMGELGVRELPSGTVTFLFTDIEGSTHDTWSHESGHRFHPAVRDRAHDTVTRPHWDELADDLRIPRRLTAKLIDQITAGVQRVAAGLDADSLSMPPHWVRDIHRRIRKRLRDLDG